MALEVRVHGERGIKSRPVWLLLGHFRCAGAIEGAAAIANTGSYLQSLSFQQLISCDESNLGCDGGFPASAIVYANNNRDGGMAT